jgi:cell division control protein 45
MGAILDLPSEEWFGSFENSLAVHVIDSNRPQNLSTLFGSGDPAIDERIVLWDDGGADSLSEERKAWESVLVSFQVLPWPMDAETEPKYDPQVDESDSESDFDLEGTESESEENPEQPDGLDQDDGNISGKRVLVSSLQLWVLSMLTADNRMVQAIDHPNGEGAKKNAVRCV